jgi:hypothetical protein
VTIAVSSVYVWILVFLVVALVALLLIWFYARSVKRDLDESPTAAAGAKAALEMSPAAAARLRELSTEPILLKRSDAGVRVQIEHRPMLPLMAFVGQDVSAALNEAAARVSQQWGSTWVALLTAGDDGRVTAQRLA